ncbi:hypothetical protein RND71_006032 [Anisodus tanguticus]|uniref:Uncharacterized protein n=1 Tax=Anisodus tanguticus TaxID=243964 RepID=A0AAE1VVW8_9SOLA|nr:hypothetical protein RND71_006032 [Anisodus tanguticus]
MEMQCDTYQSQRKIRPLSILILRKEADEGNDSQQGNVEENTIISGRISDETENSGTLYYSGKLYANQMLCNRKYSHVDRNTNALNRKPQCIDT